MQCTPNKKSGGALAPLAPPAPTPVLYTCNKVVNVVDDSPFFSSIYRDKRRSGSCASSGSSVSVSPMSNISNQLSCCSPDQHSGAYDCMYMQFIRGDWCPLFLVLLYEILKEVQASNSRVVELRKNWTKCRRNHQLFKPPSTRKTVPSLEV